MERLFWWKRSEAGITQMLLFRATEAYGQFLERGFNPLAKFLLLRTSVPIDLVQAQVLNLLQDLQGN